MKKMQNNLSNKPTTSKKIYLWLSFLAALGMGLCYLSWRALYTINYGGGKFAVVWSFLLLLSECYTFMIFTSFSLALIRKDSTPKDNPEIKLLSRYPSVDVFVCTYNESLEILTDTLIGCTNIDYPNKKVYVLDDGRRPSVKELADSLGCNYITRPNNKGYKAGNINNALRQTDGELILIFDADHVPVSTFLNEIIHNFEDEKVALVQTPQHFFNPDPFQKNLSLEKHLANEQDLFYRVIEPGLAAYKSAVCCGTNFVVRRKYVDEVGGMPEDTITEDSALGLMLESKGYKINYYNKPIAAGRAPETFAEYLKQRSRWAKGNVQIFMNFKNLKYIFKLNPIQFFFHFNGMLYFLYSFPRIVFLFSPVLFLIFDVMPVTAVVYQVVLFQASYFILKLMFAHSNCGKYRQALITDVYESATAPFLANDIIRLLLIPSRLKKQKFAVTEKGENTASGIEFKYFLPVFLIMLLLVVASAKGIYDLYHNPTMPGAIAVNIFWNTYNMIVMIYAVRVVVEKPEKRKHIRIPTDISMQLINAKDVIIPAAVSNLSKGGALIKVLRDNVNTSTLEKFMTGKLFLLMPDETKTEIQLIDGTVNSKTIYLQVKFVFDNSVKTMDDPLSLNKKFIRTMYQNSYAWE